MESDAIVSQFNFAQGEALGAQLNCTNAHTDRRVAEGGVNDCEAIVSDNCRLSDVTLIMLAKNGDDAAFDTILTRYKPLVKTKAKDYFLLGGDLEDLIQEGMIGLYKAVRDYSNSREKKASFATFASLCVVRQIQTAIKAANRQKHMALNSSVELDRDLTNKTSPETLVLGQEAYRDISDFIQEKLSSLENSVLMLHMDGKSHLQIAEELGKSLKAVDNAIQRIRRKVGDYSPLK